MDADSDLENDATSLASDPPSGNTGTSESYTSYNASVRSSSLMSIFAITPEFERSLFRQRFGRSLNNYSDVYLLPADEEEFQRLDIQHSMFMDITGSKYSPPMGEVMADDVSGQPKAVLDLGCGSGSWILDVVEDFPTCTAVAVDLVPLQLDNMPANLRSEVDDINLGLEHFYGDFDVVHTRLISSGIRDFHRLIDQAAHVLRPRGLLDISEYDVHVYDHRHHRYDLSTKEIGPPWFARFITFMYAAIKANGGDADAATHIYDWVKSNPAYEDVVYREFWLPAIPPPPQPNESEYLKRVYLKMLVNVTTFIRGGRPALLGSGLPEDIVNEIEVNAIREVEERRSPQYSRLQCVYARKKANVVTGPDLPLK